MSNSRLRVLSCVNAFPPVTSSSELERVGSRECDVNVNMVGCEKPDLSDDSSLSSVSSEELDIMGSDKEEVGRGKETKRKTKVSGSYLACHEHKFPSDSEEGGDEGKRDVGRGTGRGRGRRIEMSMVDVSVIVGGSRRGRPGSLSKVGGPGWFEVGGGQRVSPNIDQSAHYHPRFGKPTLFTVPRRCDSPPVIPLGGFKSNTMSSVNPSASLIEVNGDGGGKEEPRKRRPRFNASLKICSNFVNDVLSKKHKGWVWPLYKPDRGKDSVFTDPIYLVDIKTKLADRKYSRPEEFAADMRKLIGNYCRYYSVNHQYHNSAKQLQEMFEQEFKNVLGVGDGNKWGVGGGVEVRGQRFKECVVEGSPNVSCPPVPASTPLVVSAGRVEGGVGKKGVAVSRGASLSVFVPDLNGCGVSSLISAAEECVRREVGRVSEGKNGCSSEVVCERMNATLPVLKTEVMEEVVRDSVQASVVTDIRVVGAVMRGADVLQCEDDGGVKKRKVGEGAGAVQDTGAITQCADLKINHVCKWILEGFTTVPANEQELLLHEIRGSVGVDQLEMEGVVLGTLSNEHLSVVANLIVGALTGVRTKVKCEETSEGGKGVANEVITSSQSAWHKMQQDLSSIRDTAYATLIKINHMQEFSFETLNDLHEKKNDLSK